MNSKEQAELMVAEFSLVVLSKIGHKLDMSDVTKIAKSSASLAVDRILDSIDWDYYEGAAQTEHDSWKEVKQHIEAYGKDQ